MSNQLGRLGLLNKKYLHKRNDVWYFCIKIGNQVILKSLYTNNYDYANILKLKIYYRIKDLPEIKFNKTYSVVNTGNGIIVTPENEEERKRLDDIERTVTNKINRLSKSYSDINHIKYEKQEGLKIKECCDEVLEYKTRVTSPKTMLKYKQALEYILIFFGANKNIRTLTNKDASEFRNFILAVPKNWKGKADLKNKNIKLLYQKKSKLLEKYPKQELKTIDEVIKRVRSIFQYFEDHNYISQNIFKKIEKLSKNVKTKKREFKENELQKVIKYLDEKKLIEEKNFFLLALMTGMRRGEILQLKLNDLDMIKQYIDTDRLKTEYSKRVIPIHKDLKDVIKYQIEAKTDEEYLFFNQYNELATRDEKVGLDLNEIIKIVLGEELKPFLDLHSLRKTFIQEVYLSDLFKELDYKTLIGHSTNNDITDKHYIRGKRDYQKIKDKLDKISFKSYYNPVKSALDNIGDLDII